MALTTRQKINFLQNFIKEWHREISNVHLDNIVGFRIGKKIVAGKEQRNISIIIQVVRKLDEVDLIEDSILPREVSVTFPDGKTRIIKTDIEETGRFGFQSGIGSEVHSKHSIHFGSAGLFVIDETDRLYALTNYHVVAESFIARGRFRYFRPPNRTANDVRLTDNSRRSIGGRFEIGLLSHEIDAAFVELFVAPNPQLNVLPDGRRLRGRFALRPLPPSLRNKRILVYSFHNPGGAESIVYDNSAVLRTDNPMVFFEDIIQIRPRVTEGGDSGGLVVLSNLSVLGIIVGADNLSTYAIPFYKIDDFKRVNII